MTTLNRFTEVKTPFFGASAAAVRREERMPDIVGVQEDVHQILDGLDVALVGVGALGGRAAIDLARMRAGRLRLIDPKKYKSASLLTQPIPPEAIGAPKASYIGRLCKSISPETEVYYFEGSIEGLDVTDLHGIDAFLLAGDNLRAEVDTCQKAISLARPVIHGAVDGATMVAQVRTYANRDSSSPCPGCGYNDLEWQQYRGEVTFACDAGSNPDAGREINTQATFSIPPLCGIAANLMGITVLKLKLPFGQPVGDTLYEYCAHTGKTTTAPLPPRKADCVCDHVPWDFRRAAHSFADSSLESIARDSGIPLESEDARPLFRVAGFDWVESVECINGHRRELNRFAAPAEVPSGDSCPTCGAPLFCPPIARRGAVSSASLGPALQFPLRELGVEDPDWVQVSTSSSTTLIQPHTPKN